MSVTVLSRERGCIIRCACGESITTGQIQNRLIRGHAKETGWIRRKIGGGHG